MSDHASLAMSTVRVVRLLRLASPANQTTSCLQARAPDVLTTAISALWPQLVYSAKPGSTVVLSTAFRTVTLNVLNQPSQVNLQSHHQLPTLSH